MSHKLLISLLSLGLSLSAFADENCERARADNWKAFQSEKLSLPLPRIQKMMSSLSAEDFVEFKKLHFAPVNNETFKICMEKCESTGGSSSSGVTCQDSCEQMAFIDNVHAASEFLAQKTGVSLEYENLEEGQILEFITDFTNPQKLMFGYETTFRTPKGIEWFRTPYELRKKLDFAILGSPEQTEIKIEVCTSDQTHTSFCTKYAPLSEYMESQLAAECPRLKSEDASAYYRLTR